MSAVDFSYLEGVAAGDFGVVREVLALFVQQTQVWAPRLDAADAGWRDVAHTVKGAARGIGANALGEACQRAEAAGPDGLAAVHAELQTALAAIADYRGRTSA